nr:unnamed protein product [Callosobruchus chinensis]
MLNCSICKKTFKNSCVDISSAEVRLLNSNKGCDWSCRSCRAFGNEMKDLKALILKLQEDIQVLKSEAVAVNSPNQDDFLEEIITEVEERSKRRKNLVIFGVPEQDQSLSNNDQVSRDVTNTVEILRVMNRDIDAQAIKPIRLGKHVEGKSRPIKVYFGSEQQVTQIIHNARALRNSRYKKVSVSYDRTPRQQAHYKRIKEQLQERENAGEANLKIKYVNGTPRIVSGNQ